MSIVDKHKLKEQSSSGQINTPIEIAQKMVDSIPQKYFTSTTSTFLEPAYGNGTFIIEIIRRLRKFGHSMENIQERIYGFDNDVRMYNNTKRLLRKYNFHKLYNEDFLESNFYDMKFDIVIGNPPYNDTKTIQSDSGLNHRRGSNLARLFLENAINLSKPDGKVLFILPISRTLTPKVKQDVSKIGKLEITDASEYFPKVKLGKIVSINLDKAKKAELVDHLEVRPKFDNNLAAIRGTMPTVQNTNKAYSRASLEALLSDTGKYEVWLSPSAKMYTDDKSIIDKLNDKTNGKWRVVIPGVGDVKAMGKIRICPPHVFCHGNCKAFITNSEQEAIKLEEYLKSDLVSDIIKDVKTTTANSKKFFEYIENPL